MPPTVLVIDDNKSVCDSLAYLFGRRGYEVLTAENGQAGVALAAQHPVAAVLLDVNMPGLSGLATCRALLAQAATLGRPISVWMITGARTPELERRALEAGALALLAKPFDLEDMFRRVGAVFGEPALPPGDAAAPVPPPPVTQPG